MIPTSFRDTGCPAFLSALIINIPSQIFQPYFSQKNCDFLAVITQKSDAHASLF